MFTPIDFNTWPRREMFYYFSKMAPTGYSLTVNLDVTHLRKTVKEAGLKFFPAYLWLVTRCLSQQPEFKCAIKDGQLGYYDTLTPLYATMHPETHTISLMWTQFCESFPEFHQRYVENQKKYGDHHGVLSRPELPPENAYTVSCVPWVDFTHFSVQSYENKDYFFPSVEAGKMTEVNGKWKMPLSLTCHHATTDGWHIQQFLSHLQESMDTFERFLK